MRPPVDFAVYDNPLKDVPAEVPEPLSDYLTLQAEESGEDPPWRVTLVNAIEAVEAAGHDAGLIEPVETAPDEGEDISGGVNGQTDPKGRDKNTVPDIGVTEATPALAGQSPTENDSVPIASPSKQMPKQSHSPSQPLHVRATPEICLVL